jgi:hypothetical protein
MADSCYKRDLNDSLQDENSGQMDKRNKLDVSGEESENWSNNSCHAPVLNKFFRMKDGSKNVKNSYKSPLVNRTKQHNESSAKSPINLSNLCVLAKKTDRSKLNADIERLKREISECDEKIAELNCDNYDVAYLDSIIDKLHVYNDVKDTAQTLLERVAHVKSGTIKQMHELYGIDVEND